MLKIRLNLRKVAAITACLTVTTMFSGCGDEKEDAKVPVLTTAEASSITATGAISGGNVTSDGGAEVTERGVYWGTVSSDLTVSGSKTADGKGTGSFTSTLAGLTANSTYYVCAYATNSTGTAFGNVVSFTTAAVAPVLTTAAVTAITATTAIAGGNITDAGTPPYTERGICYATTDNPTIEGNKVTAAGNGTGDFTAELTNLTAKTKYYVRAYVTNSVGTVYGNEMSFTTDNEVELELLLEGIYTKDEVLTTSYMYDTQGRLTVVYNNSAGRVVYEFKYDAAGNIIEAFDCPVDKNGNIITLCEVLTFKLNNKGLLETFTNNVNQTSTYSYDNNGNLLETQSHDGSKTTFDSYDSKKSPFHSCTTPQWVLRNLLGLNYGLVNNPLSGSRFNVTFEISYEYNVSGYPTKITQTAGTEVISEITLKYREK